MEGKRFIHSLTLRNILSFGSDGQTIELGPLNVLIGPNGSGKSNFVDVVRLLQACPSDLAGYVRSTGGILEWLWKGAPSLPVAEVETVVGGLSNTLLGHHLAFTAAPHRLEVVGEEVEDKTFKEESDDTPSFYYRFNAGQPILESLALESPAGSQSRRVERRLNRENLKPDQSILSHGFDYELNPEIAALHDLYRRILVLESIDVNCVRRPAMTDQPEWPLMEDSSNLPLVFNHLEHWGLKQRIRDLMRRYYPPTDDLWAKIEGGRALMYLRESGMTAPIPATRLSDGTLRFLCLVCLLCDPEPPPLICIEEPELGQHPDMMRTIAEILVEASERTQLIVTTHSDHLVSALTSNSDSVIVCEKKGNSTTMCRLDADRLEKWLEDYALGDLWLSGEIGGTRW